MHAVEPGADGVDVQEEAPVAHLAQAHGVDLHARAGQDVQGGAHRRLDGGGDHDEAGARSGGRGHGLAELVPADAEALGAAGVLVGQVHPRQRRDLGQAGQRGDEGLRVQRLQDLDGDHLPCDIEGRQARGRVLAVTGDIAPGDWEQGPRNDLEHLLADRIDQLGVELGGDRVSELRGDEVPVLELEQSHQLLPSDKCARFHCFTAPSNFPGDTGICDAYHVSIRTVLPACPRNAGLDPSFHLVRIREGLYWGTSRTGWSTWTTPSRRNHQWKKPPR